MLSVIGSELSSYFCDSSNEVTYFNHDHIIQCETYMRMISSYVNYARRTVLQ
jgi:hypothetical protein